MNGYIEEMMNGQKVVRCSCHEDVCRKEFDILNDELPQATPQKQTCLPAP